MLLEFKDTSALDSEPVEGCSQEETDYLIKLGEEFIESQKPCTLDRDEEAIAITKQLIKRKDAFKTEYVEYVIKEIPVYDFKRIHVDDDDFSSTQSCSTRNLSTRNLPTVIDVPRPVSKSS